MKYDIYVFLDNQNRPYYVGRTGDFSRRRKDHLTEIRKGNTLPKYKKARDLIRSGHRFKMKSIVKTLSLEDSMELEKFFINKYRKMGFVLYNLTSGGDDSERIGINYPNIKKPTKKRYARRY